MTIYSPIASTDRTTDPVTCVHELLAVALDLADTLALPGAIGAHLDHALILLHRYAGTASPALLDA
ncbi:MAG: hypothetical protein M3Q88_03330 [Pseudomonadota bacterium]|nr:hypothetical protein [Pseudomonadota bacterium]